MFHVDVTFGNVRILGTQGVLLRQPNAGSLDKVRITFVDTKFWTSWTVSMTIQDLGILIALVLDPDRQAFTTNELTYAKKLLDGCPKECNPLRS